MADLNRAMIIGHVGRDPEVSEVNGVKCARFSVATSRRYRDEAGQAMESTEWHSVTAWERLAENIGKYLRKGDPVYVEGEIRTGEWKGRDGTVRRSAGITARQVLFLGGRKDGEDLPE